MNTTEIGREFEQAVGRLYEADGFEVSYNQLLQGRSGATYEIDILGVKKVSNENRKGFFKILKPKTKTLTLAVECKFKESGYVDHEEVSVFLNKLDDIRIEIGAMATNRDFTENAYKITSYRKIDTLNGKRLNELFKGRNISYYCQRHHLEVDGPIADAVRLTFGLLDKIGIF